MTALRPELPPPPPRIAALPVDHRGYPVPYFVAWIDGRPDHRIMDESKLAPAARLGLCWICGGALGRYRANVIGPMCSITRTIAEPPSHRDCAEWSARACPFLSRPYARRRENKPDGVTEAAGIALQRNPGAVAVWITDSPPQPFTPPGGGVLFDLPDPVEVVWVCEGREATRAEVEESIRSGLPLLLEHEGDTPAARAELDTLVAAARRLLPAERSGASAS